METSDIKAYLNEWYMEKRKSLLTSSVLKQIHICSSNRMPCNNNRGWMYIFHVLWELFLCARSHWLSGKMLYLQYSSERILSCRQITALVWGTWILYTHSIWTRIMGEDFKGGRWAPWYHPAHGVTVLFLVTLSLWLPIPNDLVCFDRLCILWPSGS